MRQALCRLEADHRDAVYQGEKAPLRVAEKDMVKILVDGNQIGVIEGKRYSFYHQIRRE